MLKNLKTKKGRDESGLFIVEGEKLVEEIPESYTIICYAASRKYAANHDLSRFARKARLEIIRDSLFESLDDTKTPQGLLAICEQKRTSLDDILRLCRPSTSHAETPGDKDTQCGFFLLGESISDPGNMGTLIRTAAAAGASGAVFTSGSTELHSPKVIRASAGAVLRLPCAEISEQSHEAKPTLLSIKAANIPIYAAHPRGTALPYELPLHKPFCVLIGNEAHGISREAESLADALVKLPMQNELESLNAAVAGGILL